MKPNYTERLIASFASYKPGWEYGDGVAFKPETIAIAQQLNQAAKEAGFETCAFPGKEGEILVVVYRPNDQEFTVDDSGAISLTIEEGDDYIEFATKLPSLEEAIQRIHNG